MEKIKLTEKEIEYLNDFVKKDRKTQGSLLGHTFCFWSMMENENGNKRYAANQQNNHFQHQEKMPQRRSTKHPHGENQDMVNQKKYTEKHEAEIIGTKLLNGRRLHYLQNFKSIDLLKFG